MATEDQYLMMALLSVLLGMAILILGGSARPPNVVVVLAGTPVFLAGAYGTLFYWARGRFRQ